VIIGTIILIFLLFLNLIQKLFGKLLEPTAEYLGSELKRLVQSSIKGRRGSPGLSTSVFFCEGSTDALFVANLDRSEPK
jgi:hypothetical protein